jgi:hypothetical protein
MPQGHKYFDRSGRELTEREALHDGQYLKNGVSLRVHMNATDSARSFWDAHRDSLVVTDADATASSGNRPGWRIADSDFGRAARDAAYADYERRLTSSYKLRDEGECPDCEGTGTGIGGEDCERCEGSGELPDDGDDNNNGNGDKPQGKKARPVTADRHTVNDVHAVSAAHQRAMDALYRQISADVSQQWRRGK